MIHQVWKYPLRIGVQKVVLHDPGRVRFIGLQHGDLFMWAEVSPGLRSGTVRDFAVVSTGSDLPGEAREYHGSVVDPGGFVWHVYELL